LATEPAATEAAKPKPARPKITISKETTYITGPLRPDGYPDYLAALNELTSRGVTPENNAAVPFLQAVGPKSIPAELRPQFFKLLGIKELPEKGAYIVSLGAVVRMKREAAQAKRDDPDDDDVSDELLDQLDRAGGEPWSPDAYPVLFAWLTINESPLRTIAEGVKRPRFYTPIVAKAGESLYSSILTVEMGEARDVGRLFRLRAMLRLKGGNADEAWQDLLACHRLSRLMGQKPTMVDQLVAAVVEGIACRGDAVLAHHGNLTAKQAAAILADLDKLPALPRLASVVSTGERYYGLDAIVTAVQTGPKPLFIDYGTETPELEAHDKAVTKLVADPRLDWGSVFRGVNAAYDRVARACNKPAYSQMREAVSAEEKAAANRGRQAAQPSAVATSLAENATPQSIGQHLATLVWSSVGSAMEACLLCEIRTQTSVLLSRLAFALAGYRSDHDKYPATLAELKPKYISEIPKDLFTDKDLIYRPQDGDKGYVLYSLGPNGRDDGGRNANDDWEKYENVEPDQRPDDIAIRTPATAGGGAK
jgi:hypothetical protein